MRYNYHITTTIMVIRILVIVTTQYWHLAILTISAIESVTIIASVLIIANDANFKHRKSERLNSRVCRNSHYRCNSRDR